jgi:hypothetical protein
MQRTMTALAMLVLAAGAGGEAALSGSGEWQSLKSEAIGGKWTVTLARAGERVDGELTLTGSNVFTGGKVAGTIDGASIVLGVMTEAGKSASFSGKLDGKTIAGEWEAALVDDHGVWFGTLAGAAREAN